MKFKHHFQIASSGLRSHKVRTLLTILGIVIGIAAVILVMSVSRGAERLILSQIQGLGTKTIAVLPGRQPTGPSDFAQIFSDSLTERDLTLLQRKENVPNLNSIMPVVFGGESASFGSETYRLTIFGATDLISRIFDLQVSKGAFFTDDDVRRRAEVAVIGSEVKEKLFGLNDALGERIRVKNRNFRVVGVLPKVGQKSFFNFDQMMIVPYSSAQQYIFGIKYFHRFIIESDSEEAIARTVSDIKTTLRNSHSITDPDRDDFHVETAENLAETIGAITQVLSILLVSIAAISLLVGGVGIMNIMLVSVTERTREIGLRKAVGATEKNILKQFLLEAVILTFIGGILGIILGVSIYFLISLAISRFLGLDWTFSISITAIVLGLGVSTFIGIVFGLYPARKASQKSPIEALRYE
ncbi:MAG: ABC transporter permease [Candidatus Paceibacterota bacterium]|nr:MAG: ABC transporter permease [Candidatus Paceibacterota bacterium]